ncbi:MAG: hypothetical protein AAGH64_09860, partial [Planctomycetota bacterium]
EDLYTSGAVDRLSAALDSPNLRPPLLGEMSTIMDATSDSGLSEARLLAFTSTALARHHIREGDHARAAERYNDALRVVGVFTPRPTAISTLIGVSIESRTLDTVREAATHDASTAGLRAAILREMLAYTNARSEPYAFFEGEHLTMLDTIRALYTGGAFDGESRTNPLWVWWNFPSEETTCAHWERVRASFVTYTATPAHARAGLKETPDSIIEELTGRSRLIETMTPALTSVVTSIDQGASLWNGELVRLAILVHRDRTGVLPETLDDLVASGVLPALPKDPYAPDGRYRYTPDDTAANGFVLYAVGLDSADNDGAPNPDHAHFRWLTLNAHDGFDYIIHPQPAGPSAGP